MFHKYKTVIIFGYIYFWGNVAIEIAIGINVV